MIPAPTRWPLILGALLGVRAVTDLARYRLDRRFDLPDRERAARHDGGPGGGARDGSGSGSGNRELPTGVQIPVSSREQPMNFARKAGGLAVAFALIAGAPVAAQEPGKPADLERARELAQRNNETGIALLKAVHGKGKDTFISPASIAIALQWASLAADGETLAEMLRALRVEKLDVRTSNRSLLNALGGRTDIRLDIADSMWFDRRRLTVGAGFLKDSRDFFDAEAHEADFADPATTKLINAWVEKKTSGKIPELLGAIPADAILYLINAVYFKGTWTTTFDKELTKEGDFTRQGGEKKKLPFMKAKRDFEYFEAGGTAAVRLPFGKDMKASMWVVLPPADASLDDLVGRLAIGDLKTWGERAAMREGVVRLPRFKLRWKATLNDGLATLGMKRAFSPETAEFPGLGKAGGGRIFISRVLHEAVVEVNEEGAEAAAATAVEFGVESEPPPPFRFEADRPFLFLIVDDVTGAILFLGAAHDPEGI